MTTPLDEKGRADKLVQIARIIARNIDEERFYDAPAFQRAAQDVCAYLSHAPAPDELEVVAWDRLRELIAEYFDLGYAEGVVQRTADTMAHDAQRTLSEIEAVISQARSTIAALRAELDEAQKLAGLGCDANQGGAHTPMKRGNYTFCTQCGETLNEPDIRERARTAEAEVKRLTEDNEALRGVMREALYAITEIDNAHKVVRKIRAILTQENADG